MAVLEVSLDIRDSGRGMNSRVSENPTRALFVLGVCFGSSTGTLVGVVTSCGTTSSAVGGFTSNFDGLSFASGKARGPLGSKSDGLEGALLPLGAWFGLDGCNKTDRSWLDIAADRLWACPRRPGLGTGASFGEAKPLSNLVGLVLRTVMASPALILPPTNSLPPRLWPAPEGLVGIARGD